ncbi:MAG TPA: gamma carbonic anhydrase family protein [Candidatus Caccousia avistercoris]|nr:gamma carbonic anhydrase family protein [Candidatus Caccousia avistercoris]
MKKPSLPRSVFLAPGAQVVGDVQAGENCSIWYNAVLRGDCAPIRLGQGTNIQDGAVLHCTTGLPTTVGDGVTVGHNAILHSCTVHSHSLIGMGAIVLDNAVVGEECLVGAGALVTPRTVVPAGSLVVGSPARVKRPLTEEEKKNLRENAEEYLSLVALAQEE